MPVSVAPAPARHAVRVSLACVQCRSRHVRCDAATPVCGRCRSDGSRCVYLPSRRKGRSRGSQAQAQGQARTAITPLAASSGPAQDASAPPLDWGILLGPFPDTPADILSSAETSPSSYTASKGPLLDLYYANFHNAHPFVLPSWFLEQKLAVDLPDVRTLVLVMQFVGSLYTDSVSSGELEEDVRNAILAHERLNTGFIVQALLLYAICVYWRNEVQRSQGILQSATLKAIDLGMNRENYAVSNSRGDAILAESWRRTWWQLYLTDLHVAAIARHTSFRTSQRMVETTVKLPCEEADYKEGVIAQVFRPRRSVD